jgi:hypothetical protein
LNFGPVRQVAYLTDDIEGAMRAWVEKSGVGPFTWYRNLTLPATHKGQETAIEMEVGIAFRGDLQIELIQQTNDAPSPYLVFFQQQRMGLHQIAFVTEDIDQSKQQAGDSGFEIITDINAPIGRYAYFQDPAMPENFYEFLEVGRDLAAYWQQCIDEARDWDGKNPVREMDMTEV